MAMGTGSKKTNLFRGKTLHEGSLWAPCLLKIDVLRFIFEGLTLGWYLVLLLEAHGFENMCFPRWLTFTEHTK